MPLALHRRAGLVAAVTACVVAGGLGLLAAGRDWVSFTVDQSPLPSLHASATGHVVAQAVAPLAVVVLAGVVAFPATRKVGRRLAGLLVSLAGAGLVVSAAMTIASPRGAVSAQAAKLAGRTAARAQSASASGWPWVVVACGVLALAAGAVTIAFGRDWPAMGRRYEAEPGARRGASDESMWERLDRGDDPTIDPTIDPATGPTIERRNGPA